MIVQRLSDAALRRLFGEGLGADVAARGTTFLAGEARRAIDREDEHITRVRLRPGERYTVIARPPATRRERKLAAAEAELQRRDDELSRPTRAQVRSAKKLSRAQRKLDRTPVDSRRRAERERREATTGARFDRRMRPSKKQLKVSAALTSTSAELAAARAVSLQAARSGSKRRTRRERVTVYD